MGKKVRNFKYDYTDLKKLILIKCGSLLNFAEQMGWDLPYLSNKLSGRIGFTADDVVRISYALSISKSNIGKYFFTLQGARLKNKIERELERPMEDYEFETEID